MPASNNQQDDVTSSLARTASKPNKPPAARLCVVYPEELVTAIPLSGPRLVLGRRPDVPCSHVLVHPTVSRQHFTIEWSSQRQCHVGRDTASRNGSWLNGEPVQADPVALTDGAVLRFGDVLAVYECGPGVSAKDPPDVSHAAVPGDCAAVRELRHRIACAAYDPSPVLVIGATGTGKELVSAELHRLSGRKGSFVPVNAAALTSDLVESQLFGHVKGAFTGAERDSQGMFRAAHGGSLFLDEIGEMPLALQPKLLRSIQEREVSPVGTTHTVAVDVRIIAATNRNLAEAVEAGLFRRDLYARLNLWQLWVPPLRERRSDVLRWLDILFEAWLRERGRHASRLCFDANAAESLLLQPWPENLRGLNRLVHELASRASADTIKREDLPGWLARTATSPATTAPATDPVATAAAKADSSARTTRPAMPTREQLVAVLESNEWSVRATAKHFDRERRQVYRWMDKFGIKRDRD